jgi:hypothetical protein
MSRNPYIRNKKWLLIKADMLKCLQRTIRCFAKKKENVWFIYWQFKAWRYLVYYVSYIHEFISHLYSCLLCGILSKAYVILIRYEQFGITLCKARRNDKSLWIKCNFLSVWNIHYIFIFNFTIKIMFYIA